MYRYTVITLRFTDKYFQPIRLLLHFGHIPDPHTGEQIKKSIIEQIGPNRWNILNAVQSIVLDNASNNLKAINLIRADALLCSQIPFGGALLLQRCLAHILNLLAKCALSVIRPNLRSLRFIVKHITTEKQINDFNKLVEIHCPTINVKHYARPSLDCKTRWNSCLEELLEPAIPLQAALIKYSGKVITDADGKEVNLPPLDDAMFLKFKKLIEFLTPLRDWTKVFCKQDEVCNMHFCFRLTMQLSEHIHKEAFDPIMDNFDYDNPPEEDDEATEAKRMICHAAREMMEKNHKYFSTITDAYKICHMLDPRCKLRGLKKLGQNPDEWKKLFCSYYDKYYKDIKFEHGRVVPSSLHYLHGQSIGATAATTTVSTKNDTLNAVSSTMHSSSKFTHDSCFTLFSTIIDPDEENDESLSEADSYLREKTVPFGQENENFDPYKYWRSMHYRWPTLALFARNYLGMEATSIQAESSFSYAHRLIDDDRNSLSIKMVEGLVLSDYWLAAAERYQWTTVRGELEKIDWKNRDREAERELAAIQELERQRELAVKKVAEYENVLSNMKDK